MPANALSDRNRAALALVLVQLFFGIHYFAAKIVLLEIAPRTWAVLRAGSAALFLLLVVAALGRGLRAAPADYARLAVFSLFGVVINQLCFIEGLHRTTATHSSILITGIPVGTLLFAVLLRRERMTGLRGLSLLLSTVGVLLVVGSSGSPPATSGAGRAAATPTLTGDLLILLNALSYAFFLVISKRTLSRVQPLPATAVLMVFGTLGLLVLGWSDLARFEPLTVTPGTWVWAAFIVVFPTAIGYLLNYWALKRVDASLVGLFIYLQPVIASALAVAFLGERPRPLALFGALLIFAGVRLAYRSDAPVP